MTSMNIPQRLRLSFLSALALFLFGGATVHAFDEFSYDLRLIRELAGINMHDYAFLQVERMLKLYPEKKDLILLNKALVYYAQNNRRAADQIVDSIPKGSPYFNESRLIQAENAFRRGDFTNAAAAYTAYFSAKPKPLSPAEADVRQFLERVFAYAQVMVETGDPAGTQKALGEAETVTGEFALNEGQLNYQRGRLALAACDKAADLGKPVSAETVVKIIAKLEELQFKQTDYLVMINSLIEVSRGHVILGDMAADAAGALKANERKAKVDDADKHYKKALQTLQSLSELLNAVKEQVPPKDSPLAGAYYQYGRARKGQAKVATLRGEKEAAVKHLQAARKFLGRVREEYGASAYGTPAIVEDGRIGTMLKTLGVEVAGDPGAGVGNATMKIGQADPFFKAGDYAKAAPLYLEALQSARLSPRLAPPTALKLVVSFGRLEKMLEAQAVASYLGDVFPEAEETADALLQLGAIFFKNAETVAKPEEKERLLDEAMMPWDQFVEVAPEHAKAADIAFVIAENAYRKASVVAQKSQDAKDRAEKEKLKQEARDLYRSCIPKYERMVTVFGANPKGVRALYKLGWIYHSLDEAKPAAENFLAYSRRETDPKHRDDRLEAKFRAAEQLMFSDTPAEAVPEFEELLKWVSPGNAGGFDPEAEKSRRVREDATSYRAWSYDLAAEAIRPELQAIRDAVDAERIRIKEAETAIARIVAEEKEISEWQAAITKDADETAADFSKPLARPEEKALHEIMPEETVKKWTPEERAIQLPKLRADAAQQAGRYLEQAIQSMQGQREQFVGERAKAFQIVQADKQEIEALTVSIAGASRQLEEVSAELKIVAQEVAEQKARYETAQNEAEAAGQAIADLKKRYAAASEKYRTGTPEEKAEARREEGEIRSLTRPAQIHLAKARRVLEELQSADQKLIRRKTERELAALDKRRDLLAERLAKATRDKALLEIDLALAELQVKASSGGIDLADQFLALMQIRTPEERYAEENLNRWTTAATAVATAFGEVKALAAQKVAKAREFLGADREKATATAQAATEAVARLEADMKPVKDKVDALKTQARDAFTEFLAKYPNSKHVPDNMARVGTIFIEFNQYDAAETYLNQLATKFPGHKALKQAMFNLGKVQFEIDKQADAAEAFRRVLETPAEQTAGNLNYIVRALMDGDSADVALAASRELLARSENENHPDYDTLSGKSRENLLFRAGKAAMSAKDYKAAVGYFDALLTENDKTARFFDANLLKGRACRLMAPPNVAEARRALDQVRRFAQDNAVINEALVELAEVYLTDESPDGARKALTQLGQIVIVADGRIEVLADDTDPASRPHIDRGFYLAAKCHALIGDEAAKELVVAEYRKRFADGRYRNEIGSLPGSR